MTTMLQFHVRGEWSIYPKRGLLRIRPFSHHMQDHMIRKWKVGHKRSSACTAITNPRIRMPQHCH
jgi:hypothetical protein